MKKIFLALATLFFSFNAFAYGNSFCNAQHNFQTVNTCYRQAIAAQNEQLAKHVQAIRRSGRLSTEQLRAFNEEQRAWEVQVNNGCVGNSICVYESQVNRNNWLAQQRRSLGK